MRLDVFRYSIFEINGEKYIADHGAVLSSNPPQYNCYRLRDGKHSFEFCHVVNNSVVRAATEEEFQTLMEMKKELNEKRSTDSAAK